MAAREERAMRNAAILLGLILAAGCVSGPKLYVGAGVSRVMPEEDTLDDTYQVDLMARIEVMSLQVELSYGWKEYEYTPEGTVDKGELAVSPVIGSLRYALGPGLVRFISGVGIIWNVNDVSEISEISGIDDSVGYRALVGFDVRLGEQFRLGAEVMYDFSEADIESTVLGTPEEVDTSGLAGRVTVAYHF
jgi:hypothetical protein